MVITKKYQNTASIRVNFIPFIKLIIASINPGIPSRPSSRLPSLKKVDYG